MKNFGRIAIVLASLLATYVGAMLANENKQVENALVKIDRSKQSEFVRVDHNGNIIPEATPSLADKTESVEKLKLTTDVTHPNAENSLLP